ncbi:hypothetical protein PROFUN_05905 [Planoprotostelium fungivorum]|uniref:Acyl-coenzyme A oxidase n=1 Tax=Planoprotostelium fungivorum TaxID=1890364 RepID=A0A2P6N7K1_9EUKA|nr:hypothetical protein PROFUN_05905 [Planoprotostelium fungivorum]
MTAPNSLASMIFRPSNCVDILNHVIFRQSGVIQEAVEFSDRQWSTNLPSSMEPTPLLQTSHHVPEDNPQMQLMKRARAMISFDVQKLTAVIFGSEEAARDHEDVRLDHELQMEETDPSILPRIYRGSGRKKQYHDGLMWGKLYLEQDSLNSRFVSYTPKYNIFSASPFGHQLELFGATVKLLGDEEQCNHCTFAQTELGHGTLVRGLQTTATFDPFTDEFILHTPCVTATKYWPGGMGYSASHALVMARLIVGEMDHGVHAFLVQIRSLVDWKPVTGVDSGDIGTKMGWGSVDNGYLSFDRVRIPRRHMLMKNTKLSANGIYTPSPHDKLLYGGLTKGRVGVALTAAFQLAQPVTIATRYSTVRQQGYMGGVEEVPIIQYKTQHARLLKHSATSYAILFSIKDLSETYQTHTSRLEKRDLSLLPFTHFATSGLKAICTEMAASAAEDCRRSLGGIGYSFLSGIPHIVGDITSLVTVEGENYVMYQQAARYLMKAVKAVREEREVHPSLAYLKSFLGNACPSNTNFEDTNAQLQLYQHRAARLLFECHDALSSLSGTPEQLWNEYLLELVAATRAHFHLFLLESFLRHVSHIQDASVKRVMKHLSDLYALTEVVYSSEGSLGFVEDGYLSQRQMIRIREIIRQKHRLLLPEAVGLTDAWNFSDASLQSAVGQRDGNVYKTLMGWTRQLPMNVEVRREGGVENIGYQKYIQPLMAVGRVKSQL